MKNQVSRNRLSRNQVKKFAAFIGLASLLTGGIVLGEISDATAAPGDGVNGEVRGFLWPGGNGIPNWEGTYRMPDGVTEAWCASIWDPEPINADSYTSGGVLTYKDGSVMELDKLAKLAYIISEASDKVIGQSGKVADEYASAVAVIVHDWTNKVAADYQAAWPLGHFDAGVDPDGTGQDPTNVRTVYNKLIADAETLYGPWTMTLVTDQSAVNVGETVTVSGTLTAASGAAVTDRELKVALSGATGPVTVLTDSSGNFTFPIVVTDEAASVTVSRLAPADSVDMEVPVSWRGNSRPQNMVLVNDNVISQAVNVTGILINIGTSATDQSDGDKFLAWNGGIIVDRVAYTGLTVGQDYTVTGELMDKATGLGAGIFGETTFTAEETAGTIPVEFTVPEGHAGKTFVVFERLYDAEGELLAVHEDIDDEEQTVVVEEQPTLGTSATDQVDGDKFLAWNGGIIVDVVAFTGLIIGKDYTVRGELMDKATGLGTGIFGETTFTAEESFGTIPVEFVVPSGFAGQTLVVFERLYDAEGVLQAVHEDIDDEEQTVYVNDQPTLKTSAADQSDGDKYLSPEGGAIIDTVRYTGLTVGQEYTVMGELMDKATGKGTGIFGETTFVAPSVDGVVMVEFVVPKGYAGTTLVVFEQLYDAEGVLQAVHEDINDTEQTVRVSKPELADSGIGLNPGAAVLGSLLLFGFGVGMLVVTRRRNLLA